VGCPGWVNVELEDGKSNLYRVDFNAQEALCRPLPVVRLSRRADAKAKCTGHQPTPTPAHPGQRPATPRPTTPENQGVGGHEHTTRHTTRDNLVCSILSYRLSPSLPLARQPSKVQCLTINDNPVAPGANEKVLRDSQNTCVRRGLSPAGPSTSPYRSSPASGDPRCRKCYSS
jgi:hypothetical protein